MLFNFNQLPKDHKMIVNDSVMGGKSESSFAHNEEVLTFTGNVSTENNGGFASLRMLWPFDTNEQNTINLVVKGDGKAYQFRLRTNQGFDGASYVYEFETTMNDWQTIVVNTNDFIPSFRGRVLTNMPKLSLKDVKQMGFLIAAKQVGEFEIHLKSIDVSHN